MLASADVQDLEHVGLGEDALDLRVVHPVEVASAVDGDVELLQERETGRHDLLLDRRLRQAEHGVVGVEHAQLGAALLELFHVDVDRVARRRRDVGDVQLDQVGAARRDRLENERQAGRLVV